MESEYRQHGNGPQAIDIRAVIGSNIVTLRYVHLAKFILGGALDLSSPQGRPGVVSRGQTRAFAPIIVAGMKKAAKSRTGRARQANIFELRITAAV